MSVLVGIYYTPYLIRTLGVAAYGILPLALIINQYISVVTSTLTSAFTRFYSVSIQQERYDEASADISTSLFVILVLMGLLSPLLIWIIWDVDGIFNIPEELIASARILFVFTVFSFFVSMFSSLFNVTLYALNRLDLMNWLKIIRNIFKLLFVILFFEYLRVNVAYVGFANLLTEVVIFFVSLILFFRFKPTEVKIRLRKFSKAALFAILGMSVWVLIQQCGDTLLYRSDNLIVNHFFGVESSGTLGAISEFGAYITVIVSVLGGLFGPLILIAYSQDRHEEVKQLALSQSLVVGSLSAILAGLIAGFGSSILSIWLGEDFALYSGWLTLKLLVVPFYAAGGILAFVYRSWNRVRFPALCTVVIGVADLAVLILFARSGIDHTIEWVLGVGTIFAILQCYILNAYCVQRIYEGTGRSLVLTFVKITMVFVGSFGLGCFCNSMVVAESFLTLVVSLVCLGMIALGIVFYAVFNSKDRNAVLSLIK